MIKKYLIGFAAALAVLMVFGLLEGTITGNFINNKAEDKIIITFPKSADFVNDVEGAVIFEFRFPDASFMVGNKTADILMFLDSDVIHGLKIGYDANEKKIKAGLPVLSSTEVGLIDGNHHKVVYSFHKEKNLQSIYLDDKLIAEGEYTGEKTGESISGFAVYRKWTMIESPIGMDVSFE